MILRIELTVEDVKKILKIIDWFINKTSDTKEFNKLIKLQNKIEKAMKLAKDKNDYVPPIICVDCNKTWTVHDHFYIIYNIPRCKECYTLNKEQDE